VVHELTEQFGALLLVEVWSDDLGGPSAGRRRTRPRFRILVRDPETLPATVDALQRALAEITLDAEFAEAAVEAGTAVPPGMPPLLPEDVTQSLPCFQIGLAVEPVYRSAATGEVYPVLLQSLRQQLGPTLKKAFCVFAGVETTSAPPHYQALGRRVFVRAVGAADQRLCEVADSFDLLLLVTPVNGDEAWEQFKQRGLEGEPAFYYSPLPFNPDLLKRKLFKVPLEGIEDPTLAHLLQQKQEELDRQITMLRDRGTRRFLYGSLQVYGEVEDDLLALARDLLDRASSRHAPRDGSLDRVNAHQLLQHALSEFDVYRAAHSDFQPTAEIRKSVPANLMVSGGRLLISESLCLPPRRVRALLEHEVGTHLLTYFNGLAQPFRQMHAGLAGYEPLQEGLAVLAEYLVGGLSRARMRTLAARVVAVHAMIAGATFTETFRLLHGQYAFSAHSAFNTTLRAYRGGGLTKDAAYLRGLRDVLAYLDQGHELDPLYVGKIALEHLPFVQELRRREILRPAPLLPRFYDDPRAAQRLERCRGRSVTDLVGEHA
jgi:uncharacterized protein (TIGR02421 family)